MRRLGNAGERVLTAFDCLIEIIEGNSISGAEQEDGVELILA